MTEQPPQTTPSPQTPPRPAAGMVSTSASLITLLLTLFASLASLYAITIAQESERMVSIVSQKTQKEHKKNHHLASTLATLNEGHASLQTELSNLSNQIHTHHARTDDEIWGAEQARYYLILADMEAKFENNFAACLILLNQASKSLTSLQDPTLQPILESIESAKNDVKSYPRPDLENVLKQFHQLEDQLHAYNKLTAAPTTTVPTKNEPADPTHMQQTLSTLKKLVIIEHREGQTSDLALQTAILVNRVDLDLQEARVALLQNNSSLYHLVVQRAISNTHLAFEKQPQLEQSITANLNLLDQVKFPNTTLDLQAPLDALKAWINSHATSPTPAS